MFTLSTALKRTTQLTQHFQSPFLLRTMTTTTSLTKWDRLIRYVSARDGQTRYGEPIVAGGESKPDIDALAQKGGLKVKVLAGATPILAEPTGEEDEVKTLLGPLTSKDVPIVRCTGLNYKTHSRSRASISLFSLRGLLSVSIAPLPEEKS